MKKILQMFSINFFQSFRAVSVLLMLVILGSPDFAAASALEQFKLFAKTTQTARGQFTQKLLKAGQTGQNGKTAASVKEQSSGTFQFARPGKFIWLYDKPYRQRLQADGVKLYIYDQDLNQVTVRKLGNALGSSPAAILFGSNDLESHFTLKEAGIRDGREWLEATPKAKDSTFDHINIGLRNGLPEVMELYDSFDRVSLLSFEKFDKNPSLPPDQFKWIAPKDADVLEQ